jgi:hypothetical protein
VAFYDLTWYVNSVGYAAVTARPQNAAVAAGVVRRQFTAPAVGSERCFVCIVAGTTANTTDATWTLTRGAKTTDGTATWQECTGMSAVNGDLTNTPTWTQAKAIGTPTLGAIIQRNNGASYWICSTAGTLGASEPAWANNTAGTTQADGTTTWTCLGVVGNFSGGGAPHARLANATISGWHIAGNTVYVGDNHAESQATAITITSASSATAISKILCHNHSGSYPPAAGDLTTGATISTTAAVGLTWTSTNNSVYVYGLTFKVGVGASTACVIALAPQSSGNLQNWMYFDNCSFWLATTASTSTYIQLGPTSNFVWNSITFNNVTVKFGHANQFISTALCQFVWQNTGQILASGSSVPAALMGPISGGGGNVSNTVLEALDLSQLTGAIWSSATLAALTNVTIKDCKLNAAATVGTPAQTGMNVQLIRSDSGAAAYKSTRYAYEGTETTETSITRVGGAQDPSGQAQSRKIVTAANAQWLLPFKAESYAIWNPTTGANVTVTVYGVAADDVVPNNDEIWIEAAYLSDSGSPLGKIVSTNKASILAANAAVAADSSAWSNATYATLDPGTVSNATLSNGNLTATSTGGTNQGVRGQTGRVTGKYYFEITIGSVNWTSSNAGMGLIPSNVSFANAQAGQGNGSTQITYSGAIFSNNNNLISGFGSLAPNDVISVAVDLGARLSWFRKNGGDWNLDVTANPGSGAAGVTPVVMTPAIDFAPFILFGAFGAANQSATINFGATPFVYTSPFAFGSWPPYTMFKLAATLSSPQPGLAGFLEARVRVAKPSATYYIDPRPVLS